jgi:hypothetical protein
MTTTVWRPKVRIAVPDIDGANVDEKRREELTTTGTKRKRAPPTKAEVPEEELLTMSGTKRQIAPRHFGPCEHGVKPRSRCKVCSACPHGRWRKQCKECGGSGICEHGRERYKCKECGGASICEHGRERCRCKECCAVR